MKGARRVAACTAAGLLAGLVVSGSGVARTPQSTAAETSGYIVVYDAGVNAAAATDALEQAEGFKSEFRYSSALQGFSAQLTPGQVADIGKNSTVKFISPDGVVEAVGLVNIKPGDTAPPGIRRIGAATTTKVHQAASGFKVAVIDTGSGPHTDIARTTKGRNCTGGPHTANDDNGHGTHVAGTIAGKNNGAGVVGVTPNTKIVSVKVLHANGSGTFAEVICGIDWVAANGPGTRKNIRVANMSLSGGGTDDGNCGNTNADAMHHGHLWRRRKWCHVRRGCFQQQCQLRELGTGGLQRGVDGHRNDGHRRSARGLGPSSVLLPTEHGRFVCVVLELRSDGLRSDPHDRCAGRLCPLDVAEQHLQHDLGHEHGVTARGRDGGSLHR